MAKQREDPLLSAAHEYGEHPERYYAHFYATAALGDHTAALELLRGFVEAVNSHHPVPPPILSYLGFAFSTYLADPSENIEHAMLLKQRRGNPRGLRHDAVAMVAALHLALKRADPKKKGEAKDRVCSEWHVGSRQLDEYVAMYPAIAGWDMATLGGMARRPAQPPKRR